MTNRVTRTALKAQVTQHLASQTDITAAELRGVLDDMIDTLALRAAASAGEDVRVVWSETDRVVSAQILANGQMFASNAFNIPVHSAGLGYLVIWRSNASGGAPDGIMFDGQPQRGAFGPAGAALRSIDGVDGQYIVSLVRLDGRAADPGIGGDEMVLS